MTTLTELEHTANEEARHGNREALEAAQARIAELEGAQFVWDTRPHPGKSTVAVYARDAVWNAALEAAAEVADEHTPQKHGGALASYITGSTIASAIRALMKKEGE